MHNPYCDQALGASSTPNTVANAKSSEQITVFFLLCEAFVVVFRNKNEAEMKLATVLFIYLLVQTCTPVII